jgi:hypothetical protein
MIVAKEEKHIPEDKIREYMDIERQIHSWADDELLRRIVEDELKVDPEYYERMEEGESEKDEAKEEPKEKGE